MTKKHNPQRQVQKTRDTTNCLTMASSTPQGAFFGGFGTQSDKKKQETFKIPDNPYLSQRLTTTTRNENAVVLKSSTNHHDNDSLRQRRPLQEQQQQALAKPASSFNPPKSSLSLRTSRKSIPMDQARSQVSLEFPARGVCCQWMLHIGSHFVS